MKTNTKYYLALFLLLSIFTAVSCTPVAEIYDSNGNIPMGFGLPEDTIYIDGCCPRIGVYTIEDTTINGNQYLIGTK